MSRQITTGLIGFAIIATALAAQFAGLMNLDNSWLLHVAERVTNGEQLGRHVIESNPPLIVNLMQGPVFLANFAHLQPIYAFYISVFALMSLSLLLSAGSIKEKWVFLSIAFALSFVPAWAFGEREHIFIILILPYFVSLWDDKPRSLAFMVISGLMAGVGFSLKPFFLATWAILVLTRMCVNRRFWAFLTLQNILIGMVIGAYIAYLVVVDKTYINEILPLVIKYYGGFNGQPKEVFKQSLELAVLSQMAFWIVYIKDRRLITRPILYANFANLISVLMIIVQAKTWLNYFYPPNFFGFVSNALITAALFTDLKPLWNKVAALISTFILMIFLTLAVSTNIKIGLRINEDKTKQMIKVLNEFAAHKTVYVMTFDLGTIFPAILYTSAEYHGRYGHFWSLPGMYHHGETKNGEIAYHQPGQRIDDETRLIAQVMADLAKNPPEIIVVMDSRYYSRDIGNYKFDFVKYFSIEPEFAEMWSHYHKIKRIGDYDIYQLND